MARSLHLTFVPPRLRTLWLRSRRFELSSKTGIFAEQSQFLLCKGPKNKANSKPNKPIFNPNQSQFDLLKPNNAPKNPISGRTAYPTLIPVGCQSNPSKSKEIKGKKLNKPPVRESYFLNLNFYFLNSLIH